VRHLDARAAWHGHSATPASTSASVAGVGLGVGFAQRVCSSPQVGKISRVGLRPVPMGDLSFRALLGNGRERRGRRIFFSGSSTPGVSSLLHDNTVRPLSTRGTAVHVQLWQYRVRYEARAVIRRVTSCIAPGTAHFADAAAAGPRTSQVATCALRPPPPATFQRLGSGRSPLGAPHRGHLRCRLIGPLERTEKRRSKNPPEQIYH
jgi:hypothetical protein